MIKIDKAILAAFDSLNQGSSNIRSWTPTAEQATIIRKYWKEKSHAEFIKMFRSIYPNSPKTEKTYQVAYRSLGKG